MIIAISGGLGNQMFQYAYMISQKKRHPECNIYGDLSIIQDYHTHNGFELERVFSDKIHIEYCNEQIHEKLRTKKTFVYRALRKIGLKMLVSRSRCKIKLMVLIHILRVRLVKMNI